MPDCFGSFQSFTICHLAASTASALAILGLILLGRRWRGSLGERRIRIAWSASIVLFQVYVVAWFLLPANFDPGESFPLHLCDLAAWVAPFALIGRWRAARAILFFWGLGLSSQAFITPTLTAGLDSPRFWIFWIQHIQIVGSAIYDMVVGGFIPRWRDFWIATAANVAYAVVILPLDVLYGLNYGYVGPSLADRPTIVDRLGSWPLRIIWIAALAEGVMALLVLILTPLRRREEQAGAP